MSRCIHWPTAPRGPLSTVVCSRSRRYVRRRPFYSEEEATRAKKGGGDAVPDLYLHRDDKVVITLDFQDIRNRASILTHTGRQALARTAVRVVRLGRALVEDSTAFLTDLRSSVSVKKDNRLVMSFKRSSIGFAVNLLFWSLLVVGIWKIFVNAARKYRWGWEESFTSEGIMKRDRSLGGREVLVGRKNGNRPVWRYQPVRWQANPLDDFETLRSEKEMTKQRGKLMSQRSFEKFAIQLPSWWVYPEMHGTMPHLHPGDAPEEASLFVNALTEKRLSGKDFEEEDILQLRRLCTHSGSRVKFNTANMHDSFYRAAINFVLCACGRGRGSSLAFGHERPVQLLTGLADNIELEAKRAATMINAAVAAQTRSTFLQAWALLVQGKLLEAEEEIAQLVRIFTYFPPDKDSPEMEMVAQGLGRHLSLDERKLLLQVYSKISGNDMERIASEALGLYSGN